MDDPQATLPQVGALGSGVGNLQVGGYGFWFVDAIVERHAGAVLGGGERGLYVATRVSVQAIQIVLEQVLLNQIRGSRGGVDLGLQRRAIANLIVVFVIHDPAALDAAPHCDGADFLDPTSGNQEAQGPGRPIGVRNFAQIFFAVGIDVQGVGQDIDPQQAEVSSRAQQGAGNTCERAGVEAGQWLGSAGQGNALELAARTGRNVSTVRGLEHDLVGEDLPEPGMVGVGHAERQAKAVHLEHRTVALGSVRGFNLSLGKCR